MHSKGKYTGEEDRMNKLLSPPNVHLQMPLQLHISNNVYFSKILWMRIARDDKRRFGNFNFQIFIRAKKKKD